MKNDEIKGRNFRSHLEREDLLQIREEQRETWNRFSAGWKKWNDLTMDFLKPVGDEIIRLLKPKSDDYILDVAAGTGEPGFSIATLLGSGKVIITDLAERMLDVARENAAKRGIKNIETRVADACDLPFEDNTFDAISCRFGFMFFADMELAAKEMVRVLKPGGRVAISVWYTPEKNFWITATMNTLNKNMHLKPVPAGAPGIFRCAQSGLIADLFSKAGLKNISESEVPGKLKTGTTDIYWNYMTEVVAPVVDAMSKADDGTRSIIKREVYNSVHQRYAEQKVAFDSDALVIYGEK